MNAFPSHLDRFVRRVYRRLVVLRLLEWAAIGFATGCAAALLMILLLRNRPQSSLMAAAIITGTGAALGLIAALLRRPRLIDAAAEADRQLDLSDLLATAWHLEEPSSPQSFEAAVLLIANERAAHLQPRSVVLHRLGIRAWSGIGLAGALVLSVAIFTANPIDSDASTSRMFPKIPANQTAQDPKDVRNPNQSSGRRPTAIAQDHPNGENDPLAGAGKTTDATTNTTGQNASAQATNPDGGGPGAGRTNTTPDRSNPINSGANSSRPNNNGAASSGVGNSADSANTTSGNSTSTSAGNSGKSSSAPAWQSDSWPAAQQAADSAITSGQIPPAYHDLVREYFKR